MIVEKNKVKESMCLIFPHCLAKAGIWGWSKAIKYGTRTNFNNFSYGIPVMPMGSSLTCFGTLIFSLFKYLLCLTCDLKKTEEKQIVVMSWSKPQKHVSGSISMHGSHTRDLKIINHFSPQCFKL